MASDIDLMQKDVVLLKAGHDVLKQAEYCYFIGEDYWKVNKRMFIK